jgi:hypothetical protein
VSHYRDYNTALQKRNSDIRKLFAPFKGRAIFVFHPAFEHFTDAYDLKQISIETEIEVEGKPPGPKLWRCKITHSYEYELDYIFRRTKEMFKQISRELKNHVPFTVFGAITGIIIMVFFQKLPSNISYNVFYVFHPIHVVLSALVTASMYDLYTRERVSGKCLRTKCNFWILLIIGYIGSIGIATLSDSIIPYLGEVLLRMPKRAIHIGFIEKWWLVNPLAIVGVVIAAFRPTTKFPHAGHVLLSTWASLFHIIMALGETLSWFLYIGIFIFLFLAVWIPCCVSDIVFPLLFVKSEKTGEIK